MPNLFFRRPGMRIAAILFLLLVFNPLSACSPKVGSKEWCEEMKKKPKGDWSANEAADYAKNCMMGGATPMSRQ